MGEQAQRAPQTPIANAGSATLSGLASNAATYYLMTAHPELGPLAPVVGAAVQGAVAGAGNKARTTLTETDRGVAIRALAWIFSWLS